VSELLVDSPVKSKYIATSKTDGRGRTETANNYKASGEIFSINFEEQDFQFSVFSFYMSLAKLLDQ